MDASAAPRKRKSRFSDAVDGARPQEPPLKKASTQSEQKALDPAALAKAAAEKISRAIPGAGLVAQAKAAISAAGLDGAASVQTDDAKRLRTLQIAKSVQEQMEHMRALLRKPGDSAPSTFMPAPLLLDDQGRQIDESGKVVADAIGVAPVVTLKANKATNRSNQNPYLSHRSVDKDDKLDALDPRLRVTKRETRATKSLNFVKQGTYVKQAEQVRAREAKKMLAGFTSGRNPRGYEQASIVPMDEVDDGAEATAGQPTAMEVHDVDVPLRPDFTTPDVEWWDVDYLPKEQRDVMDKFGFIKHTARKENPDVRVDYNDMKLKCCGTSHVIEHPARLNSMVKKDEGPIAIPLMLTAAERKKIRRQNRADREKEKQDKIALGLLPPPEPKVKLSNMMRVLSEQAVADPSAIEKKVRQQIAQREKNHEMRNLARKLTPEERREKKLRKIKEDAAGDIHVALFKVPDLSDPKNRFKVDVNAQQYHLTGGVLICKEGNMNAVVAEGGKKAIKHYIRLMTKRINWKGNEEEAESEEEEDDDENDDRKGNGCKVVWQGIVARKAFNNFRFQECRTSVAARKVLEQKNVAHYWDLVESASI
ncbi:TPA: hypothetical protein N0F65_001847 [Lagenidium giganteum]|uniref:Uncharacterized protein n=1 Tax=Lagenidium giganteum TaxID=4803 RepID=A0AAV2YP03_9STRA|nr:TPA: hypothetical protein N0F65_001847 [Lagenidium giganteum]